jgi:hypothetical protein
MGEQVAVRCFINEYDVDFVGFAHQDVLVAERLTSVADLVAQLAVLPGPLRRARRRTPLIAMVDGRVYPLTLATVHEWMCRL